MPSTVTEVFAVAGSTHRDRLRWGTPVPEAGAGVYVVSLAEDAGTNEGALSKAAIRRAAVDELLTVRPELLLRWRLPDAEGARDPAQRVLACIGGPAYIGLADQPLRTRVRHYYRTPLGAKRPHAGGWWLKTLSLLGELWVHWAPASNYEDAERTMLRPFEAAPELHAV